MVPPELKARVLSAAAEKASPARSVVVRSRALSWLGASLWILLVFSAIGGLRAVERPVTFVLWTIVGWAAIAFLASWASSRGGSMIGRPVGILILTVAATPLALEVWYAMWVGRSDAALVVSPIVRGYFSCAPATLGMGVAPFVMLLLGRRGSVPNYPRPTAAAMGVVSGAWGAVLIDFHCERADLLHVTLGHILPVLLLALAGYALGATLLGVRGGPKSGTRREGSRQG
jgi:hypothetical protein